MYHFVTEICTHVHISVTKCCIVGYGTEAFWDAWDRSISWWDCAVNRTTSPPSHHPHLHPHLHPHPHHTTRPLYQLHYYQMTLCGFLQISLKGADTRLLNFQFTAAKIFFVRKKLSQFYSSLDCIIFLQYLVGLLLNFLLTETKTFF